MKIGVISLGCAKNQVDTERMLGLLAPAGYAFTEDPAQAEVLIVNTCGFIDPAKEESINSILEMAQYKQTGICRFMWPPAGMVRGSGRKMEKGNPGWV